MDKYYTQRSVAILCAEAILKYVCKFDRFIEPSAGDGAFVDPFPYPVLEIDLYPERSSTVGGDWLEYPLDGDDWVIFGNPPFGNRGHLSDAFIKKAVEHAKCVAFILPDVYHKERRQRIFPDNWALAEGFSLPKDSFIYEGESYHVPCSFFIWVDTYRYHGVSDLRESVKEVVKTDDFVWDRDGEWFIFGAAPQRIIPSSEVNKNNRGYAFNAKEHVVDKMRDIDWKQYALSSANGGVSWYTKRQIVNIYELNKEVI